MSASDEQWMLDFADHYTPQRELGRGGMSVVYLMRDRRHNRDVALKMLLPDVSATVGRDRFMQEVTLTARLQHPHILPVFDSGESGGRIWYTMPYVEGETLRARLDREHALPVDDVLQIATEVASALAYAHGIGVVHRDIKPENILLSRHGDALVADFGVAKALGDEQGRTGTGVALGTPGYMAPEQLMGERPVRVQVDVYALGMVLYEMLTGSRPYEELGSVAMLAKLLADGVPGVAARRTDVPASLADIVSRALQVDPNSRPASGSEIGALLQAAMHEYRAPRHVVAPATRATRGWIVPAVALIGVAAVSVALVATRATDRADGGVAVIPFENRSADTTQSYLSEGVAEELTARIAAVSALRVTPRSAALRFGGNLDAPEQIARALSVQYLVTGSVRRLGDTLRVTAELLDGIGKRERWSHVYAGPSSALAGIVDSIAHEVLLVMAPAAATVSVQRSLTTRDARAYQYYLLAQHHWNRFTESDLQRTLAYADSAIARDPVYVSAWVAKANALVALSSDNGRLSGREALALIRQATDTVLALDPTSAAAHGARAWALTFYEWDWAAADREYRQLFSGRAIGAVEYVRASFIELVRGHTDSAMALVNIARRLDPTNVRAFGGPVTYFGRRYAETLDRSRSALLLDPYFPPALQLEVLALSAVGRHVEAIAEGRRAVAANPAPILALSLLVALARADSVAAARQLLASLDERAARGAVSAGIMFRACAILGERDRAFLWLNRAIDERLYNVAYLNVDPMLDSIRSDPRFDAARARAGLPRPQ